MRKLLVLCVALALGGGCTVERHYHVIEAPGALRAEQPRPTGRGECALINRQWICEADQAPRPVYRVVPPQPVFPVYHILPPQPVFIPPYGGPWMYPRRPGGVWWGIQF